LLSAWIRVLLWNHLIRGRRRRESTSYSGSTGEKAFLENLRESRNKAGNSATSSAPGEDCLLQIKSRESIHPENPIVHLIHRKMDTDYKEKKETKTHQAALLVPPPSKENRKKLVVTTTPL
jgi:hypothetical protein